MYTNYLPRQDCDYHSLGGVLYDETNEEGTRTRGGAEDYRTRTQDWLSDAAEEIRKEVNRYYTGNTLSNKRTLSITGVIPT